MTAKDYALIAAALALSRPRPRLVNGADRTNEILRLNQWENDCRVICEALQAADQQFDRREFYETAIS
jgi:hypothetical protein